jgi:hypothetical protein
MSRLSGSDAMTKKRKIGVSQETFDDFLASQGMLEACEDHAAITSGSIELSPADNRVSRPGPFNSEGRWLCHRPIKSPSLDKSKTLFAPDLRTAAPT